MPSTKAVNRCQKVLKMLKMLLPVAVWIKNVFFDANDDQAARAIGWDLEDIAAATLNCGCYGSCGRNTVRSDQCWVHVHSRHGLPGWLDSTWLHHMRKRHVQLWPCTRSNCIHGCISKITLVIRAHEPIVLTNHERSELVVLCIFYALQVRTWTI